MSRLFALQIAGENVKKQLAEALSPAEEPKHYFNAFASGVKLLSDYYPECTEEEEDDEV